MHLENSSNPRERHGSAAPYLRQPSGPNSLSLTAHVFGTCAEKETLRGAGTYSPFRNRCRRSSRSRARLSLALVDRPVADPTSLLLSFLLLAPATVDDSCGRRSSSSRSWLGVGVQLGFAVSKVDTNRNLSCKRSDDEISQCIGNVVLQGVGVLNAGLIRPL
jgi:hypothetical protein